MSEITKELFYTVLNSGDIVHDTVQHELHNDVIFIKHGVKFISRNNYVSGINYYIEDINK